MGATIHPTQETTKQYVNINIIGSRHKNAKLKNTTMIINSREIDIGYVATVLPIKSIKFNDSCD